LSGKRLVWETSCPGNVFPRNVLSGKVIVRERSCPGNVLSGERLVQETSCPGNVLSGKRLSGKVIVRETSVKRRWQWQVQYTPCLRVICPVPFPSRLITTHSSTVTAVVNNTMFYDATRSSRRLVACDDCLVQQRISRLIAFLVLGTKCLSATPL